MTSNRLICEIHFYPQTRDSASTKSLVVRNMRRKVIARIQIMDLTLTCGKIAAHLARKVSIVNVSTLNWRELIFFSWKSLTNKLFFRPFPQSSMCIACKIQEHYIILLHQHANSFYLLINLAYLFINVVKSTDKPCLSPNKPSLSFDAHFMIFDKPIVNLLFNL